MQLNAAQSMQYFKNLSFKLREAIPTNFVWNPVVVGKLLFDSNIMNEYNDLWQKCTSWNNHKHLIFKTLFYLKCEVQPNV